MYGHVLRAPGSIPCSPRGEYLLAPCLDDMEELSAPFSPACDLKEQWLWLYSQLDQPGGHPALHLPSHRGAALGCQHPWELAELLSVALTHHRQKAPQKSTFHCTNESFPSLSELCRGYLQHAECLQPLHISCFHSSICSANIPRASNSSPDAPGKGNKGRFMGFSESLVPFLQPGWGY